MSLELNYKAKNIAAAEREFGLSMFTEIDELVKGQVGVNQLAFFICAGGIDEDSAYDEIDKNSVTILQDKIIEELFTADFLVGGKQETRQKVREAVKQGKRELEKAVASQSSGEAKKPKPTK